LVASWWYGQYSSKLIDSGLSFPLAAE